MDADFSAKRNGPRLNKYTWVVNFNYQGNNQIGAEGCKYLCQAVWPVLLSIILCILFYIQRLIKSAVRVVNISVRRNGLFFKILN
jgi:hypothetical protein